MKTSDGTEWSFWAANEAERGAWLSDLTTTRDMLELNLLTDANLQAAAGALHTHTYTHTQFCLMRVLT